MALSSQPGTAVFPTQVDLLDWLCAADTCQRWTSLDFGVIGFGHLMPRRWCSATTAANP